MYVSLSSWTLVSLMEEAKSNALLTGYVSFFAWNNLIGHLLYLVWKFFLSELSSILDFVSWYMHHMIVQFIVLCVTTILKRKHYMDSNLGVYNCHFYVEILKFSI